MNKKSRILRKRSAKKNILIFRLYVHPEQASSLKALENLKMICSEYFGRRCRIEVIDTLKEPSRAQHDKIAEIPTLIKLSPKPSWTIVGDLSEDARVLASMKGLPWNKIG